MLRRFQVQTPTGPLLLINMYNDVRHSDSVKKVVRYMRKKARERSLEPNAHSLVGRLQQTPPDVGRGKNSHLFTQSNLDKAQEIIDTAATYYLQMILPKNIPTLRAIATGNYTRPDNAFASTSLCESVVEFRQCLRSGQQGLTTCQ